MASEDFDDFGEFDDFQAFEDTEFSETPAIVNFEEAAEPVEFKIIKLFTPYISDPFKTLDINELVPKCIDLIGDNSPSTNELENVDLSFLEEPLPFDINLSMQSEIESALKQILRSKKENKISFENRKMDLFEFLAENYGCSSKDSDFMNQTKTSNLMEEIQVESLSGIEERNYGRVEMSKQTAVSENEPSISEDFTIEKIRELVDDSLANPSTASEVSLLNAIEITEIHIKNALDRQQKLQESTTAYNQVIQGLIGQAEKLKVESSSSNLAKQSKTQKRFSFLMRK
ncbi:hypothetical protein BB560_005008 [Smittium megazygosporum]|uniref:Uncharacterized protein n=1 Tax=Smittium megazygosporum TaxID=133381 RepID=A0A2T9Z7N1_9FUNG|nr:hypothetical protein BB560_005008 [Smittium megazygosporum]